MKEKFMKEFYRFCKENKVKPIEMKDIVRDLDLFLSTDNAKLDNHYGEDYTKDSPVAIKIAEFHDSLVTQCIEFIKNNPDLYKMIKEKQEEVKKEWDCDFLFPDIRVDFGVDGLDESVKNGEWVPATDSYFGITVGSVKVIERM